MCPMPAILTRWVAGVDVDDLRVWLSVMHPSWALIQAYLTAVHAVAVARAHGARPTVQTQGVGAATAATVIVGHSSIATVQSQWAGGGATVAAVHAVAVAGVHGSRPTVQAQGVGAATAGGSIATVKSQRVGWGAAAAVVITSAACSGHIGRARWGEDKGVSRHIRRVDWIDQ